MRKILTCFLLLFFIQPFALNNTKPDFPPYSLDTPVYVSESNIFSKCFTEPVETLYLIFYNGDWISFSTHETYHINIDAWFIKEHLKTKGKKLEDVAIMIHNHYIKPFLSGGDVAMYKTLKRMGFKGSFCIYITSTKKIRCEK